MSEASTTPLNGKEIRALLFDKDGTLFGFQSTWGGWTADMLRSLAPGMPAVQSELAERLRLDLATRTFLADSVVIAGTLEDTVELILPVLEGWTSERLHHRLLQESLSVQPVEAVPLRPLLARFAEAGLALGIATNDSEEPARVQLQRLGLETAFTFIAGSDSGFGAKPGAGQCQAFADAVGIPPNQIAMIGDSTHDLRAGGAAGMVRVGVLTGVALAEDLAADADIVLSDIGELPDWLGMPN